MKVPRDVSGHEAVRALIRLGFEVMRQTGSHVQMSREGRHVTIPAHDPIRVGALKSVLRQAGIDLETFVRNL